MNEGYLLVNVYADDISQPIEDATVKILETSNTYQTDENGQTSSITLETFPRENSLEYNKNNPYKTYSIEVTKDGMTTVTVTGIDIFEGIKAIQDVKMKSNDTTGVKEETVDIEPIVISGNYSSKYPQDEQLGSQFVLNKVIVPEYIIVHDGAPADNTAPNLYVSFPDYIKNVASSEIYPTWPLETLRANIIAIMSFTLNRVYTEWYPSKGYRFTITSVTTYDQKYTINRTIYDSISQVVDDLMLQYLKRPGKSEPLFAQYCDGESLREDGWLWQWGSADLGEQKVPAADILKYYYGNDLEFAKATYQEGLPTSFPGYVLALGSCGEEVKLFQNQINIVRGNYPGLIQIDNPNGEFDENTEDAVKKFQEVFGLTKDGIVGINTWYKISYMHIAVSRMIFGVYDRE